MRNIVMVIGYDGTGYSGFQTQPHGNTIQDKLEFAVKLLTGETVKVHGSGRTDAGVHARAQVIHFHTQSKIPVERWCLAMNTRLPADIIAYDAWEAPLEFHSRKSAKLKTYRYSIQLSKFPNVFHFSTRFHYYAKLDLASMKEAFGYMNGEHDFTSFCSVHNQSESRVRTVFRTELTFVPEPLPGDPDAGVIHFEITGNGFLYNMVRIIVGTLLEVGEGKRRAIDMSSILEARNRSAAGPTAVAHGLTLWNVEY